MKTYLSRLTTSAVRAETPLVDFQSTADVEALLDAHEAAEATSASVLNNHLSALRQFWTWLEGTPEYGHADYRFRKLVENVEPSDENPGSDPVDPEFVPSESEAETLRVSATVFPSRDGALVEFLADAGPRNQPHVSNPLWRRLCAARWPWDVPAESRRVEPQESARSSVPAA